MHSDKKRKKQAKKNRAGIIILATVLAIFGGMIVVASIPRKPATAPSAKRTPMTEAEYNAAFRKFVRSHPSPEVRALEQHLNAGRLRVGNQFYLNGKKVDVPEMLYVAPIKAMVFNEDFFRTTLIPECERMTMIRHETQHFLDHLAGMSIIEPVDVARMTQADARRFVSVMMHCEWHAGEATIRLERDLHCAQIETDPVRRCAGFKELMLTDGLHLAREFLAAFPETKRYIENVRCDDLLGPY